MAPTLELSLSQMLEAIQRVQTQAPEEDKDAFTSIQVAAELGIGEKAARNRLQRLMATGEVEPVRARKRNKWGIVQTVMAYRLVNSDQQNGGAENE